MLWSSGNIMQQGGSLVVLLPLCQSRILYNQEKVHKTVIIKWYLCDSVLNQRDFVFFFFFFGLLLSVLLVLNSLFPLGLLQSFAPLFCFPLFSCLLLRPKKEKFCGKIRRKETTKEKRKKKGFLRFKQIRGNGDHVIYRLYFDL